MIDKQYIHCKNINIEYYENSIKIIISQKLNNNIEKYDLYIYILNIFRLNKVDIIINYDNKEYQSNNESDLKNIFKNLIKV